MRTLLLLVVVSCLTCVPAAAQPGGSSSFDTPRVFLGAAIGFATRDPDARMRLYRDESARYWTIDGGIGFGSRFSAGFEYSRPKTLTGSTVVGVGRTQIAGRQDEQLALVVVHGRIARRRVWAIDAVGGAGVLVHRHYSGNCTPPTDPRTMCPAERRLLNGQAPAMAAGVDVPVRAARHLAVVFQSRYYVLRRGDNPAPFTFQVEHHSSKRFFMGAGARVTW